MKRFAGLYIFLQVLIATVLFLSGCGTEPLFDELATNRLNVVIKGTYESNNPCQWWNGGAVPDLRDDDTVDDSMDDFPGVIDSPTQLMMDIAEIQLDSKKFALYRETFTFNLNDSDPFFDGTGISYRNDDVEDKSYHTVQMYIRKMIFNNARKYRLEDDGIINGLGNWVDDGPLETIFEEGEVEGYNFNLLQLNTYYDSLRKEKDDINRVFPLVIPIDDGLVYDRDDPETVLEIRLVIKNFIKQYEYDFTADYRYAYHFFGLSDWKRDVLSDDTSMGGNVLAVARTYVPGKTVTISDTGNPGRYVIALTDNNIADYTLTIGERTRPIRPTFDPPRPPDYIVTGDIESYLEFYLKYEKYKYEYNNDFFPSVQDGSYATEWENYEAPLKTYKIPPLATWNSTGTFTLTNVPVGKTYYVYESDSGYLYGEMPASFTYIGSVTVTEDQAGQTLTVP